MSEVAGRMSVQVGAAYLEKEHGDAACCWVAFRRSSRQCSGAGRWHRRHQRARVALGMALASRCRSQPGSPARAGRHLQRTPAHTRLHGYNIERAVRSADLVIGGVLIPGAAAPRLVTRAMVGKMKKGAVIVDVAIDQGGCVETARPTTHSDRRT